jgi:hypothetical protein
MKVDYRKELRRIERENSKVEIESLPGEIWKDVVGLEDSYMISNLGRVKSKEKIVSQISRWGNLMEKPYPEKLIKQFINTKGYYTACIKVTKAIHRLVAIAFIPNPENKREVNHKDGNKLNNNVINLEWATSSENRIHSYKTGLQVSIKGSDNKQSKPILQYSMDGIMIKEFAGAREASRVLSLEQPSIWKALNGFQKTAYGYIWKYKNSI